MKSKARQTVDWFLNGERCTIDDITRAALDMLSHKINYWRRIEVLEGIRNAERTINYFLYGEPCTYKNTGTIKIRIPAMDMESR